MNNILTLEGWFSQRKERKEREKRNKEHEDYMNSLNITRVDGSSYVAIALDNFGARTKAWRVSKEGEIRSWSMVGNRIYTSNKGDLILDICTGIHPNTTREKIRVPSIEKALLYMQEREDKKKSKRDDEDASWDIDLT